MITMKYHYIPIRLAKIKKENQETIPTADEDMEKLKPSSMDDGI